MGYSYTNKDGVPVDITTLSDEEIVDVYRWVVQYIRAINNVLKTNPQANSDPTYVEYTNQITELYTELKQLVKSRKIILNRYAK